MMKFADALRVLNEMKSAGVVQDYAVAGALAMVFWSEPVPTFDLDVLVVIPPSEGPLVSLAPIYRWAADRGFPAAQEHIVIGGVPTQFLPSPGPLADEAIATAASADYEGVEVRVVRPEHLIALFLMPEARSARRMERVAMLLEEPGLNRPKLDDILKRHGLSL